MVAGMKRPWCRLVALIMLGLPLQIMALEILPDPTRPAIDLGAGGGWVDVNPAPREGVQSVIISPKHRAAIINGRQVELGGKVGNARLVEVNEQGVVLLGEQGSRRVMELFPTVAMKKHEKTELKPDSTAVPENKPKEQVEGQPALTKEEGEK